MADESDTRNREDYSRFLVHLTRDNEGNDAEDNLINILKIKKIEAKNHYSLFVYHINKHLAFKEDLRKKFNVVCFTEVPLDQIKHLCRNKRRSPAFEFKPYGLIFWKSDLLSIGTNPAIYLNSSKDDLCKLLIGDFKEKFDGVKTVADLINTFGSSSRPIVKYYSLINKLNKDYDFTWEREWRYTGDFNFEFNQLVAIIAENPEEFIKKARDAGVDGVINKIPVINPDWGYEEIIEKFTHLLWGQ